jgi:DNA-binding Xre family transcriptional regulator
MTIQTASELVMTLADRATQKNRSLVDLAEQTGLPLARVRLLHAGAWETLTVMEIAAIIEALDLDLRDL